MELRLAVPAGAAGERLDRWLATVAAVGSRSEAERLLAAGRVTLDGRAAPKSRRLEGGEEVVVDLPGSEPPSLRPEALELTVAYEDEHLLVVDKPPGMVVHPSAGHATGTLVHGLLGHGVAGGGEPGRPGIVHRLDRDTSGLLVVARDAETQRRLQRLLRRRELTREYLALACGRPRSWRGRIEAPIGRDRTDPTRNSLDTASPREAITQFEVAELLAAHALLRVRLETGRTHQIRVHLAAIGLPVAGDPVYGRPGELGLARQFLHAARLAFPHPASGEPVDVESALPADLAAALERARGRVTPAAGAVG
ncbi:MAG: RluA family pseudouridine synthase [Thermoleophilia bacterium]|nr:RluA family pseudouridine synthase [Thermoleophilia bacterium]